MSAATSGAVSALLVYEDRLDGVADKAQAAARMIDLMVIAADKSKANQTEFFGDSPVFLNSFRARGFDFEEALAASPVFSAVSPTFNVAAETGAQLSREIVAETPELLPNGDTYMRGLRVKGRIGMVNRVDEASTDIDGGSLPYDASSLTANKVPSSKWRDNIADTS